jgi:hypothetical protein
VTGKTTMPKWDYVCVNLVRSYGMNYRRNGIKMGEWKDKQLFEMMAIMGEEGYEFAAYDGSSYIFKKPRPVPQQPGAPGAPRPAGQPGQPGQPVRSPGQPGQMSPGPRPAGQPGQIKPPTRPLPPRPKPPEGE